MTTLIDNYWQKRMDKCKASFEKNNFEVFSARNIMDVKSIILHDILPSLRPESVSWGDSISMVSSGILQEIEGLSHIRLIKTFEKGIPREEIIERRRQALLVDLFLTGSNAVTEDGKLINLDMVGNRVAGLTFGPRHVVIVVGRNKIVATVEEGMKRVKNYSAPMNAMRHEGLKTPCIKTGYCADCKSPDRICNTWTITEKSFPKGRIKIILVNEDLGL